MLEAAGVMPLLIASSIAALVIFCLLLGFLLYKFQGWLWDMVSFTIKFALLSWLFWGGGVTSLGTWATKLPQWWKFVEDWLRGQ